MSGGGALANLELITRGEFDNTLDFIKGQFSDVKTSIDELKDAHKEQAKTVADFMEACKPVIEKVKQDEQNKQSRKERSWQLFLALIGTVATSDIVLFLLFAGKSG